MGDASEIMAAFVRVTRGSEAPPMSLVEAAERSSRELAEWRFTIKAIVEMVEADVRY
jgi:hypothetical protein